MVFIPHSRKFTLPTAHFETTTLECFEMNMGRLLQKANEKATPPPVFCHLQMFSASWLESSAERAVLHYLDRQSLRNSTVFRRSRAYQAKNIS